MIEINERGDAEAKRERQQACAGKCRRGFQGSPTEFASDRLFGANIEGTISAPTVTSSSNSPTPWINLLSLDISLNRS